MSEPLFPMIDETQRISEDIIRFARMVSSGDMKRLSKEIDLWYHQGERFMVRLWQLPVASATIAAGMIKGSAANAGQEGLWILDPHENIERDNQAMGQVLVRILNDDLETALDLIGAHAKTDGVEGLIGMGMFGVRIVSSVANSGVMFRD